MADFTRIIYTNTDNERPDTFFESRSGDLVTHSAAFGEQYIPGTDLSASGLNNDEDGVHLLHQKIDKGGTAVVHEELQNMTLQEQLNFINGKVYKVSYTIPYNGVQKVMFPKTVAGNSIIRVFYSGNTAVSITKINDLTLNEGGYNGYKTDEDGANLSLVGVYDGTNGANVGPIQVVANYPDSTTVSSHAETTIFKSQLSGLRYTSFSNHIKENSASFSETIRGYTAMEAVFDEGVNSMIILVHDLQNNNQSIAQKITIEVTYF